MECSTRCILTRWRKWIRFVVLVVYIALLGIALPLCILELQRKGAPDHVTAWFVGGLFVMMALPISLWGILQHVINYTTPRLQRYIIRILWMVPIYALNAWFALRFPSAAIYLDTLRECYEAYVIYNFMAYLMSFLHHEYPHLDIQVENKPPVNHVFPLCLLPPCINSPKFVKRCKHGVLQYTIVRPSMTIIALICEIFDKYGEGDFNFTTAWSYIVIINNMSQILAMYCLVLFYKAFKEELQPLKPVPKFLCVKAVVFMSFWQALVIAILAKIGALPQNGTWVFYSSIKEVATGLQDFLICIEMFFAAIAHYYSFSHKPFVNLAAEQQNFFTAFISMWDVRDVTEDVVEHARYIGRGMHKTLSRGRRMDSTFEHERTPLLVNADASTSGSNLDSNLDRQTYQTRAPPSPAVVLDASEVSSDADSLASGHRYNAFVNKSTTSSMNNYAEFEESTGTDAQKSRTSSVSLKEEDESREGETVSKRSIFSAGSSDPDRVSVRTVTSVVSKTENPDDIFEHLDVQEEKDEERKDTTAVGAAVVGDSESKSVGIEKGKGEMSQSSEDIPGGISATADDILKEGSDPVV